MRRETEKEGRIDFREPCSQLRGSSAFQSPSFASGVCFPLQEQALCSQNLIFFFRSTHIML